MLNKQAFCARKICAKTEIIGQKQELHPVIFAETEPPILILPRDDFDFDSKKPHRA